MKAKKSFNQELQEWAVRTADFYHEKATNDKKFDKKRNGLYSNSP